MKIAIIGATGWVGSHVLEEALSRGHDVTAIARHPESLGKRERLVTRRADIADPAGTAAVLAGHDAVISAVRFLDFDGGALIDAVKQARVPRLLIVGGAGSLEVAPGAALVDSPDFPVDYKAEALAGRVFLEQVRGETELDWTFLSPSADLHPGERTGTFRLGDDALLVDANGRSHISVADFAIAMIDELERARHTRRRFTAGY